MQVYEWIIVREFKEKSEQKMEIVSGPDVCCAKDIDQARTEAVIQAGIESSDGIKVLVRPFVR